MPTDTSPAPAPAPATPDASGAAPGATTTSPPAGTAPQAQPPKQDAPAAPAADAKGTTEPPKSESPAPAELELKLPEGVQADEAMLSGFKALAKTHGFKGEAAQAVVDLYVQAQQSAQQAADAAWEKQQQQWAETAKADKELGGASFGANQEVAKRAIQRFASAELQAVLKDSGLANHPEMLRFAYRIGKAMSEDSVAGTSAAPSAQPKTEEALHRAMYPTMYAQG